MPSESASSESNASLGTRGRMHSLLGLQILATGAAVPEQVVLNEDLVQLGCDADWIVQRTGIRQRRHAPRDVDTSTLAAQAARACLAAANRPASDVDLIVVATATPDTPIPSTACHVQQRLQTAAAAMDVNAACSGFVYGLVTASQFVSTGASRLALVIGADLMSRTVNPRDPKTYPLFGDGAGAVLVAAGAPDQGFLAYTLGADGNGAGLLCMQAGGTREPIDAGNIASGRQFLHMDGRPVFKWAVRLVADSIRDVIGEARLTIHDIDVVLLHQANMRIIDAALESLGVEPGRAVVNVDRLGNTSAASIPLALQEACDAGRVRRGSRVLMCGFGAGLTWGTAVFSW